MSIIIHFLLGFSTSFLGTLTPSMLNMTTAKISLTKSKSDAIKFAIGGFYNSFITSVYRNTIH